MKKSLSEKIIDLRKNKGLSQEELASKASINLRTLQRIEKGLTAPRGYTLRVIAEALDVKMDNLTSRRPLQKGIKRLDLQLINLSALIYWIIPFGNVLAPLLIWKFSQMKDDETNEIGRRVTNFQITWSLLVYPLIALFILLRIMHISIFIHSRDLFMLVIALKVLNTLFILISSLMITYGNYRIFPFAINIINKKTRMD